MFQTVWGKLQFCVSGHAWLVDKVACTVCLAPVFNSILDIRKHMKQEHSGLGMPRPHCNDIYFDQKTLRHHVRRVNQIVIYRVTQASS